MWKYGLHPAELPGTGAGGVQHAAQPQPTQRSGPVRRRRTTVDTPLARLAVLSENEYVSNKRKSFDFSLWGSTGPTAHESRPPSSCKLPPSSGLVRVRVRVRVSKG